MTQHILIVEDESGLSDILQKYLIHAGFDATVIDDGLAVESWVIENKPDLILLDRMLPGKDGISICQGIRETNDLPIIMITALREEEDRLLGFDVGADDYICKPFSAREVVARVKTVLRRISPVKKDEKIKLDDDNQQLLINGESAELTQVEYRLFKLMYTNPTLTFNRQKIMDEVYEDYRVVSDRSIDSHIKNLRKKIDHSGISGQSIKSVYGLGYRFVSVE